MTIANHKHMKKLVIILIIAVSCAPKTGFDAFFEKEVAYADQAIDLPKWLPMLAIPQDAKEDIKLFTRGMKRVKLLRYVKNSNKGMDHFKTFKQDMGMEEYLNVRNKDVDLNVISKEDEGAYKEIILSCYTDGEYYIFGMTGKMLKADFQDAVAEANKQNSKT